MGPNGHIRKCGVISSHASESFKHLHTGEGGIGADSVTRLDLARTSTLRYLEYSASRHSSLPINHDCQRTATNYLLYQSRAYTEHQIFVLRFTSSPNDI